VKSINFNGKSVEPSKVVCVGRNYVEHIQELNNEMPSQMVLFNKPNSAITDSLRYFSDTHRFECELCFLMQEGKISGIGLGLDLTDKKAQEYAKAKGLPWERAKAFDNSAVLSDFIAFSGNLEDLSFKLYINDKLQQEADFDLMIYKPLTIVDEIQTFMTLEENDIIMSGTPKGVGSYRVGDKFSAFLYEGNQEILKVEWVVL
jgi:2-keto-4-pentenoate hydratase/2-oxohepta-3-ene-1,7-dioic acid hydratase in catechol pathway